MCPEHKNLNIITVDWSYYAIDLNYFKASNLVPDVGNCISSFSNSHQVSPNNVQCVGFSLGCHVCGFASRNCLEGKFNSITGIDCAAPCFKWNYNGPYSNNKCTFQVPIIIGTINLGIPPLGYKVQWGFNSSDSIKSLAIHTSSLGVQFPIANKDVFLNNGNNQLEYGALFFGFNHLSGPAYYADGVKKACTINPMEIKGCQSMDYVRNCSCDLSTSTSMIDTDVDNSTHIYQCITKNLPILGLVLNSSCIDLGQGLL